MIEISDEADYEMEGEEEEEDWEEGAEADVTEKEKEQQQQEARPLKFQTTWKALSGKEQLPGVRSGYYTKDTLFMADIEEWKQKVLRDLQPRSFRVVSLVATASHERCRQSDEFPQELGSILDLDTVLRCLEEWHTQWPQRALTLRVILQLEETLTTPIQATPQPKATQAQGRRTATQVQLSSLPQTLEAEERAGNNMPAIADRWACTNTRCRNKGKTCWRSKTPGAPDVAEDHYPVPTDVFRRWSKEVNDGVSAVEQPSPQLVVVLCKVRDRSRKKESSARPDQQSAGPTEASATSTLLNTLLFSHLTQMNRQSLATPGPLPEHSAAPNSSPIRTRSDPQDLLAEFFEWLMKQPGYNTERKIEHYTKIKNMLVDEEWELDTLRERKDGKGMTEDIWDRYGFKLGTLATVRSKISEFKVQRPRSSSSHNSNTSWERSSFVS